MTLAKNIYWISTQYFEVLLKVYIFAGLDRFDCRHLPGVHGHLAANLPPGPDHRGQLHHRRRPRPDRGLRRHPDRPHLHPRARRPGRQEARPPEAARRPGAVEDMLIAYHLFCCPKLQPNFKNK